METMGTRKCRIKRIMDETGFDEAKATSIFERYERGFKSDIGDWPGADPDEMAELGFATALLDTEQLDVAHRREKD